MILFVPVIVVCSMTHGFPADEGKYCASDRPMQYADRNLEQCLIKGLEVVRNYGGQEKITSFGCEETTDAAPGQPDGTPAR